MRGLRADGSSASPMPQEEFDRQFCHEYGWTWREYIDTPSDVIYRWAYMGGKVNAKISELHADPGSADVSAGGNTVHFSDD